MRTIAALCVLALAPVARAQDTTVFLDDFESGLSGWSATGYWQWQAESANCSYHAAPFPSGTHAVWFGNATYCALGGPFGFPWTDGFLTQIAPVDLPADGRTLRLALESSSEGEDDEVWDRRSVEIQVDASGPWIRLGNLASSDWHTVAYDLTAWAGHSVRMRLEFWTGDWGANEGYGWFVDDVRIEAIDDVALPFCTSDGSEGFCPCALVGGAGRGCPSSFNAQGALLAASGVPSFTGDTLAITASDVSQAPVTFFAGTIRTSDGMPAHFGDGRRCVSGTIVRYRASPDASGVALIPLVGGPAIGQKFGVTPASPTRHVQALYRNSAPFCTIATYNLTNALTVTWRP